MTDAATNNGHKSHTEGLIDVPTVAALLGVTERFIRRLVYERRIPYHKIGRHLRFDPADVDAFILSTRVEPPN